MLIVRGEEGDAGKADALRDGLQRRQLLCGVIFGSWDKLLGLRDGRWLDLDSGGCHV